MEDLNYIDKILKDNLSEIKIVPRKTWNDFHQKYSSDTTIKIDEYPQKMSTKSFLKIGFRAFFILSIIVGSIFLNEHLKEKKGVSPMIIIKDTTLKSKKHIQNDSLLKFKAETQDMESNHVNIRINVPVHKNVTVRKNIILTDTTNN